ncbi:MAG: hypothetical protein U1E73_09275 [Planctomycetota bacterium]|nr:hypothetical protein [Planctomycetota bacterium]
MEPTIRIQSRLGKQRPRKRPDAGADRATQADAAPVLVFTYTLARRLALAHYIERLIDAGELRNYAHAAAVLGITRARTSQLMDLALLPVDVQQEILLGTERCSERVLRNSGRAHRGGPRVRSVEGRMLAP